MFVAMQVCAGAGAVLHFEEVVQYLMEVKMESTRVSTSIALVHTSPSQVSVDTHATTESQSTSVSGNQPASTITHADSHADTQATATEHSTEKPPSMIALYADVAVDHLMDIWNILDVIAFFGYVAGYTGLVRKKGCIVASNCLVTQFR
jgi:hypothetical protein